MFVAVIATAEDDIPKPIAFARYQPMLDRSPFAVATSAPLPAATPDFAKDLYIANAARATEGDIVTLASSSDKNFKKYLTTKEPVDGYSLTNIEWSDKVGGTKVTISKDGQFATLGFNQALLTQPIQNPAPPPTAPAGVPAAPGPVPVANPQLPKPAAIPAIPTPPPHVRGIIPRNPSVNPAIPIQPSVAPAPADDKEH
jgi:hypothetical protein